MTDAEVKALGYSHRDETGRWVHKRELESSRRREKSRRRDNLSCLTCGVTDDRHYVWCWRGDELEHTVEAEARNARDLEHAIKWQPPELNLPPLSQPEREQLGRLFDALVRAREQARGETPRKLWSIREYRDNVARREGRA
jgi:hypothetical protein